MERYRRAEHAGGIGGWHGTGLRVNYIMQRRRAAGPRRVIVCEGTSLDGRTNDVSNVLRIRLAAQSEASLDTLGHKLLERPAYIRRRLSWGFKPQQIGHSVYSESRRRVLAAAAL